MTRRAEWLGRMRSVAREYLVAVTAVELLNAQLRADPAFGASRGWKLADLHNFEDNLEGTFLTRLFAEFESGLRDCWAKFFRESSHPPMKDLLAAFTARRKVPPPIYEDADRVRLYRNALVHESDEGTPAVPLGEASPRLERFFARLPYDW